MRCVLSCILGGGGSISNFFQTNKKMACMRHEGAGGKLMMIIIKFFLTDKLDQKENLERRRKGLVVVGVCGRLFDDF